MHIVIVGLGATGTEIAQAVSVSDNAITLLDTDMKTLRRALARISRGLDRAARAQRIDHMVARRAKRVFTLTTDLARCADADIVIEAVPDELDAKQELLRALDGVVRPNTILALTTSRHAIARLAGASRVPDRVLGLHFCRPAHTSGLVEIVRGPATRRELLDEAADLVRAMHKTPLVVQDSPGHITNRIAQAYYGEALALLDEGGLDPQTIDRLMEAAGFARGPFRQIDFLGAEAVFGVTRAIYEATFHTAPYRPHARLARMIEAGAFGNDAAGACFYPDGATDV